MLALLVALPILGGLAFSLYVVLPRKLESEKALAVDADKGWIDIVAWKNWVKEEVSITSSFGYRIKGTYLPLPGSQKTVIFYHGHSWSRYGSLKYVPLFRKFGFNSLIIDSRAHGASGGVTCTYGWKEKEDGKACADWVIGKTGPGTLIGLHGESLGAVCALLHASIDPRIAFVVADAAFSDLHEILLYRYKDSVRLPLFPVFYLAEFFLPLVAGGFSVGKVSPVSETHKIQAPVLFIHGADDNYTPPYMSERMYKEKIKTGKAELLLVPGARHAKSLPTNPELYEKTVRKFLDSHLPETAR